YGARRLANHLLGNASQQHMRQPATSMGTQNDQVDFLFRGELDDLVDGSSLAHLLIGDKALQLVVRGAAYPRFASCRGNLLQGWNSRRTDSDRIGMIEGDVLQDVQQVDLSAKLFREGGGVFRGLASMRAEIGRHENSMKCEHGRAQILALSPNYCRT